MSMTLRSDSKARVVLECIRTKTHENNRVSFVAKITTILTDMHYGAREEYIESVSYIVGNDQHESKKPAINQGIQQVKMMFNLDDDDEIYIEKFLV